MGKTRVSPTPGTAAESKTEIQPPSMYKVVLLNDDYTPMDFVVEVLQRFSGWIWKRRRRSCWLCTMTAKGFVASILQI